MAWCYNPHGGEVSSVNAKIGGKISPSYKEILEVGDYVSFDVTLVDIKLNFDAGQNVILKYPR